MYEQQDNNKDVLKDLFRLMPEEKPSPSFRMQLMKKIAAEEERSRVVAERWNLAFLIIFSSLIVALAVYFFLSLNPDWKAGFSFALPDFNPILQNSFAGIFHKPNMSASIPDLHVGSSIFFIGALVVVLLGGDYWMRRRYARRHSGK